VTVASNNLEEAKELVQETQSQASAVLLDVSNREALSDLIRGHDIVVR